MTPKEVSRMRDTVKRMALVSQYGPNWFQSCERQEIAYRKNLNGTADLSKEVVKR